jgi:hypothetical protein
MEGFITNYYEYHFLYITGIEHVESKSCLPAVTDGIVNAILGRWPQLLAA